MEYTEISKYEKEFALRTKVNYYGYRSFFGEENNPYYQKLEDTRKEMRECGYNNKGAYEVSMLVNSLIALLVVPKERSLNVVIKESKLPRLKETVSKTGCYVNTYGTDNLKDVIKHMRNAISHGKIEFIPEPRKNDGMLGEISYVVFWDKKQADCGTQVIRHEKDFKEVIFFDEVSAEDFELYLSDVRDSYNDGDCLFCIASPVEKLEDIVMEICDCLID